MGQIEESKYFSFQTKRLLIRPTTTHDAAFILELMNTPKWIQFIGDRNVTNTQEAEAYIENKMLPQLQDLGYSNNTVIRKVDGVKVGTCGLYNRPGLEGVDIGFAFLPQFENQGFAFESVNTLKEIAFTEFGLPQISAITLKENLSSQKLLEKIGMTFQKMVKIPNDPEELMLYSTKK